MTRMDLDNLSDQELIAQYVIECRVKGHFLPYTDYQIIDKWLKASQNADSLLLILSEILPEFYSKAQEKTTPPSLERINKKVMTALQT